MIEGETELFARASDAWHQGKPDDATQLSRRWSKSTLGTSPRSTRSR